MPPIPRKTDATLDAADTALEARPNHARSYLGLSQVGEPCRRKQWYRFRWALAERFDALTLKRFEDGHRTEDLLVARLRAVPGVTLTSQDETTGRQWEVTFGEHIKGHLDGAILGLLQAPKSWHVFEAKCCEEKVFRELEKAIETYGEKMALQQWNATYYGQAVTYMHLTGIDRHYLVVSLPGGRGRALSVRTDADPVEAMRLLSRAQRTVTDDTAPERIGPSTYYACRWCAFNIICHASAPAERNCRTCLSSTPEEDGTWSCARFGKTLTAQEQRAGCASHLYLPTLVTGEQIDAGEDWVLYRLASGEEWRDGKC